MVGEVSLHSLVILFFFFLPFMLESMSGFCFHVLLIWEHLNIFFACLGKKNSQPFSMISASFMFIMFMFSFTESLNILKVFQASAVI